MFSVFVCQIWSLQLVETHKSLCIPHFFGVNHHHMRWELKIVSVRHHPQKSDKKVRCFEAILDVPSCSLVALNNQTDHIIDQDRHVIRNQPGYDQFSYMLFMCWEDRIITYIYTYIYMYIILMSLWVWLVWKWIPLTSSCCCKHFVIPFWIQPPFISVHFLNTRPQALNLLLATND